MPSAIAADDREHYNPLDSIEELVAANEWPFDRSRDDELTIWMSGAWCTYQIWFLWRREPDVIYMSCAFDMKVPDRRRDATTALLALINERTWLGHFALSPDDDVVTFRYAQLLGDPATLGLDPFQTLIEVAVNECDRYFPAFQFVLWGGKQPAQAMAAALLETEGEA